MFHRILRVAAITLALSLAVTAVDPARAHAQDPVQQESGFKGLFGLGILGAELGLVIPAAAGLDQWWALVVFPAIGAPTFTVNFSCATSCPSSCSETSCVPAGQPPAGMKAK